MPSHHTTHTLLYPSHTYPSHTTHTHTRSCPRSISRAPTPPPQEYTAALEQAKLGLRLREAAHDGEAAVAVAAHLLQVAECMRRAMVGTFEQQVGMFEKAKGLWDGAYGKGQHVLTARCLVGIGDRYNISKRSGHIE